MFLRYHSRMESDKIVDVVVDALALGKDVYVWLDDKNTFVDYDALIIVNRHGDASSEVVDSKLCRRQRCQRSTTSPT